MSESAHALGTFVYTRPPMWKQTRKKTVRAIQRCMLINVAGLRRGESSVSADGWRAKANGPKSRQPGQDSRISRRQSDENWNMCVGQPSAVMGLQGESA